MAVVDDVSKYLDKLNTNDKFDIQNRYARENSDEYGEAYYMDEFNELNDTSDFLQLYNNIDHKNFNINDDVFWYLGSTGDIISGSKEDFLSSVWDSDDIADWIVTSQAIYIDDEDIQEDLLEIINQDIEDEEDSIGEPDFDLD